MAKLSASERAALPDSAFAYVDSKGKRRLPIHDESHVRNALARFEQVRFESEAARERARLRLLRAAKRYGIVPVGFITGQIETEPERAARRRLAQLPSGTVTFLLSDIEGSTALLRLVGKEYPSLLDEVRGVIRSAVSETGGHEVDARGDEFLAVFSEVSSALQAAVTIQRAVAERLWPQEATVRVRIGLHTGLASLTETGYVGLTVHTTARVSAAAGGGQILVSPAVREALGDLFGFRSQGEHSLAGLPEAIELFEAVTEDLHDDR